ncbi:MAG: hypothetical protein IKJ63_12075 [Clostridia bacterium]|nr:hypothetical protein [Clostridia bacterium]MBR3956194.1 hypothetical protein [Clostridia bacterium]
MILKILFGICIVASVILTPFYLEAQKNKGLKSLTLKMLDSTCFLGAGVLAMFIADNRSPFAKYILIALAMSWVGDFLLHVIKPKILNAIGFVSFMVAHVFYIIAYNTAAQSIDPDRAFLQPWGYAIPVVCIVGYAVFIVKKMNFEKLGIFASVTYGVVILIMFAKAADLAVLGLQNGVENAVISAVLLFTGAALFVASDFTISFLIFDKRFKKNYPLKIFNIATYFAGQLLLASLILTVH